MGDGLPLLVVLHRYGDECPESQDDCWDDNEAAYASPRRKAILKPLHRLL